MRPREWGAFVGLGLIWGSSFLWIKVAIADVGPLTLVSWRLLFGLAGLAAVVAWRRPPFPRDRRLWIWMAVIGITNTLLPFALISWGEQYIDSGVAAILNGTVPLFTMVIAHLFLSDDRMTLPRLVGLAVGFVGVIVLMGHDLDLARLKGSALGQTAVLLAAVSYASSAVLARRKLRGINPLAQAFVPVLSAASLAWAMAAVTERGGPPSLPITWFALAWLGLLGSCVAYLLYFFLLHNIGPTRTTLVTYIFPVVGLVLGVVFLDEALDLGLAIGALLIVAGIGVVNIRPRRGSVPTEVPAKV
ncbi:MAG: DMT family transporter [Anaerolineales bacterium]|nr:DMT family transporter [Anaerolineales bacterium]